MGTVEALLPFILIIAGLGVVVWLLLWLWHNPADAFGVVLWACPWIFLGAAASFVIAVLFSEPMGVVFAVIGSAIALIVVWVVYAVCVAIWNGVADTERNCPPVVSSLPRGDRLCYPTYNIPGHEDWQPPLFHFK